MFAATSVRATHHSLDSRLARAHAHAARAEHIIARFPASSHEFTTTLRRAGPNGLGQFSGKLFSVEQCWPEPVILQRFARQVTSAKRGSNINQITSQRIVQFQEAKLWQKGQRQISLRKTPNPQCR